jgi:hypothetical protein
MPAMPSPNLQAPCAYCLQKRFLLNKHAVPSCYCSAAGTCSPIQAFVCGMLSFHYQLTSFSLKALVNAEPELSGETSMVKLAPLLSANLSPLWPWKVLKASSAEVLVSPRTG